MKNVTNIMIAFFVALLFGIAFPESVSAQSTSTICKGMAIPTGKVIISEANSSSCQSPAYKNAWTLSDPAQDMAICTATPTIPTGWVVQEKISKLDCPNYDIRMPNVYKIGLPDEDMIICAAPRTVPLNWVITEILDGTYGNCRSHPQDGSGRYKINQVSHGLRFCLGVSVVPFGWSSKSESAVFRCGGTDPRLPNSAVLVAP